MGCQNSTGAKPQDEPKSYLQKVQVTLKADDCETLAELLKKINSVTQSGFCEGPGCSLNHVEAVPTKPCERILTIGIPGGVSFLETSDLPLICQSSLHPPQQVVVTPVKFFPAMEHSTYTDVTKRENGPPESDSSWLRELLTSVRSEKWEKAKELLDGLSDDPKNITPGWTALHVAAEGGHGDVIEKLLNASPLLVDDRLANNGRTALHIAASLGHLDAVEKLLEHGANPSLETTFSKCTPLQLAAEAGHSQIVDKLLKTKSNSSRNRQLALIWALKEGREDVVEVLGGTVLQDGVTVTNDALPPRFVVLEKFEDKLGTERCRIGKGNFGIVHRGIDCRDGNLIAVKRAKTKEERRQAPTNETEKTLKETKAVDDDLEREFHLHESLHHRNILPVYRKRLGADGNWRIHMRLMARQTVQDKIKPCPHTVQAQVKVMGSGLDDPAVRKYSTDALQGLRYLHRKKLCHFDIKPSNMLLDDNDRLMLSDFGLSRKWIDNADNPGGTLYYKAPELVNETGDYGPGADIWALACSVIYMVTGKHPWYPLKDEAVILMLKAKKHPPLRNAPISPPISPSLQDLLRKMFHQDPKERLSAEKCLCHSFVTDVGDSSDVEQQSTTSSDDNSDRKNFDEAVFGDEEEDDE